MMSKETGKRISMELTAEGARVTSLKLEGSRLVLTIEAELAESHLTSGDAGSGAPASAPTPVSAQAPAPVSAPAPAPVPAPVPFAPPPPMFAEVEKVRSVPPPAPVMEQPKTISFGDPLPDAFVESFTEIEAENVPQPFIAQPIDFSLPEESSVLGGARHGEPQSAPAFAMPGLSFADEPAPQQPEPIMHPEPEPLPEPTMPPPPPVSSTPQFASPMPLPDFGLDAMAASAPAPASESLTMPQPPPPPAPAPEEAPAAGGATVLIRYTCPKCKTQGMQAVDKVGTVVNCSNCGKAMRLVMKK